MLTDVMIAYQAYINTRHMNNYVAAITGNDYATACAILRDCLAYLAKYQWDTVLVSDNVAPITVAHMRDMLERKLRAWSRFEKTDSTNC